MHHSFQLRVGWGPQDKIGIHRVIRERQPCKPIRTDKVIFLQHGDCRDFVGMYLPGTTSPSTPADFGFAVFLAENDVDVWGIDQARTFVEEGQSGPFMADWGLDRNVDDLQTAIAVARLTRWITGNGLSKVILSGYSTGSLTGYALLNEETQMIELLRQVCAFMPVDASPVSDIPEWNSSWQYDLDWCNELIAAGEYGLEWGMDLMGSLVISDPYGESPVFPGLSNLQAMLYLAAAPIFGYGDIHYNAGIWEDEMPVGLQFLTPDLMADFMATAPHYDSVVFVRDCRVWFIGEEDVPWDDHFAQITVPILNIAAQGGLGPTTYYTLTLLGSTDITNLDVTVSPPGGGLYHVGRIDLFAADNAEALFWQPALQWIEGHSD